MVYYKLKLSSSLIIDYGINDEILKLHGQCKKNGTIKAVLCLTTTGSKSHKINISLSMRKKTGC